MSIRMFFVSIVLLFFVVGCNKSEQNGNTGLSVDSQEINKIKELGFNSKDEYEWSVALSPEICFASYRQFDHPTKYITYASFSAYDDLCKGNKILWVGKVTTESFGEENKRRIRVISNNEQITNSEDGKKVDVEFITDVKNIINTNDYILFGGVVGSENMFYPDINKGKIFAVLNATTASKEFNDLARKTAKSDIIDLYKKSKSLGLSMEEYITEYGEFTKTHGFDSFVQFLDAKKIGLTSKEDYISAVRLNASSHDEYEKHIELMKNSGLTREEYIADVEHKHAEEERLKKEIETSCYAYKEVRDECATAGSFATCVSIKYEQRGGSIPLFILNCPN